MYRKTPDSQLAFEDFYLPFGGKLSGNNRWVRLAGIIPWDLAESFYSEQFSQNPHGPSAKAARLALGALILKERLGVSDEEAVEQIIDILFEPLKGSCLKPRTYRKKARRQYLSYAKTRKASSRQRRKALAQQLRFLRRNLKTIGRLAEQTPLTHLDRCQYRNLLVIQELYRQQQWMFENRCHRMTGRIVSISQPHIRPIVRGKASAPVEFGAKLSASVVDGAVFLDRLDWDPYNESGDLVTQIEAYKQRFGCYPESVHCDKIYRTRENRKFCKKHNIRMSGPALGRPPKQTAENTQALRDTKQQRRQDEIDRIPIEGKFGQGKRRFGLDLIMSKLPETSETSIAMTFIIMNLERWLKKLFFALFSCGWSIQKQLLNVLWGDIPLRRPLLLLNEPS